MEISSRYGGSRVGSTPFFGIPMTNGKALNRNAAKQQPESAFGRPLDIVDEKLLTKGEKLAALERWRQSILDQLRATSEGMPTDGESAGYMEALEEIEEAKRRLTPTDPSANGGSSGCGG
jgi:hypothetical protein